MNYTDFIESTEGVEPLFTVEDARENEVKVCPRGYRWSKKVRHCVPKTEEDDVSNDRSKKDSSPANGPGYHTWGRTGVNGDGYAWAEPNNWGGDSGGDGGSGGHV